jgi:hypothetical protein
MAFTWTKGWTSSDDGSVLGGADLKNIQDNLDSQAMTLAVTQTVTGNKTLSGTNTHSGTNTFSGANTFSNTNAFTGQCTFTGTSAIAWLSTTTVALNADADTTIYTVPAGKRCILHHATLVVGTNAGTTVISIGADGTETDFLPNNTLSALDAQYDATNLMPVPSATSVLIKSYAAGTVIQAKVSSQAGGATNYLYLFGFLY